MPKSGSKHLPLFPRLFELFGAGVAVRWVAGGGMEGDRGQHNPIKDPDVYW